MKHINRISQEAPAGANEVQFIFCQLSKALNDLLELKSGSSPLLQYVEQKCDLPEQTE